MKIYTKTGDSGETGLFRGSRVAKHDPRVEAYGNVDECNALAGLCLCHVESEKIRTILTALQHELFEIGADLATPEQQQNDSSLRINAAMTHRLEQIIDDVETDLLALHQFILPGGSYGGALLHYVRTVCRRAERSVTRLAESQKVNPEIIRYLNRLSDLFFVLARAENQNSGSAETTWTKRTT